MSVKGMETCFLLPFQRTFFSPAAHRQLLLKRVSVDLGEAVVSPHEVVDGGLGMG